MRESWKEFKAFYGGFVLPKAWQDTCALLGWKPFALIFPVLYFLGFLSLAKYKGWNFAVDEVVANFFLSLIPVGVLAVLILLVNVAMAPVRLMKYHQRFARDSTRLARLLPRVALPRLNPEQKLRFQKVLESAEPRPVVIFYLDTPTSGAGPYASDLLDAFQAALWQTEMRREQEGSDVQGVMMKLWDHSHPGPAQSAVIYALVSVGARVGYMPGHDVGERVELI